MIQPSSYFGRKVVSRRGIVPRAEDTLASGARRQLLKEIEEKKQHHALLLEKLNRLSSNTATNTQAPTPTPRITESDPYLEPDAPKTEFITSSRPSMPAVSNPAPAYNAALAAMLPRAAVKKKPAAAAPAAPPAPKPKEPLAGPNVMNVVMVGAECAPWVKTGGLGDVMSALPKALRRRGHRVMVVLPRYGDYGNDTGVRVKMQMWGQQQEVGYFHSYIDEVDFVFLEHGCFRGREKDIYGGSRTDLLFRCALLSKAALEAVWHVPCGGVTFGDQNLCFVANDWHTALLPVYLQAHYRDYGQMTYARAILVIHNMAHQGRGPFDEVWNLELNQNYAGKLYLDDPVGGVHMNVLKAGLETAQRLVAVSTGYAWECKTPEGGWGLHQVLQRDEWKLSGIVNGMDYKEWSPEDDKHLQSDGYSKYSSYSFQRGKAACKAALQRELGLPVNPDIPLLGFIGRLDFQKGVDLITDSMDWLSGQGVQLVLLGSGRKDLEDSLRGLEARKRQQVRSWVGFSVKMAHRLTAGCDILLMPSRFEPCGLNQLYAMAYGTAPVVHAVGGLRDTVKPFNPNNQTGTGWTFDTADGHKFRQAVGWALQTYRHHREDFTKLQLRGMAQDLSWDQAAKQYEDILVAAKYQW